MEKSLLNSLLGVNSLDSIVALKELSDGKGRKPIVWILKEELRLRYKDEIALDALLADIVTDVPEDDLENLESEFEIDSSDEKGVLFILNHIKKMKKAQRILKSAEIMALYKRTLFANNLGSHESKATTGILINKKQY